MRLLDLFAGRLGWSKAFLERGWEIVAVDLIYPSIDVPDGVDYWTIDVLTIDQAWLREHGPFDFICASSPCEQFSVHGMKHFHPNPPYPTMGLKLFNHVRELLEGYGAPYVMENVKAAQSFVGPASVHAGSFYLWWNLSPRYGIPIPQCRKAKWFSRPSHPGNTCQLSLKGKRERKAQLATIPPELSTCIADYADRLLERI